VVLLVLETYFKLPWDWRRWQDSALHCQVQSNLGNATANRKIAETYAGIGRGSQLMVHSRESSFCPTQFTDASEAGTRCSEVTDSRVGLVE